MKKGWKLKKLGEVSFVSSGNSAPQDKKCYEKGTYPFIRTADVGRIRFGIIYSSKDYLNQEATKKLKVFKKGTILFPKSGASTFLNHRVLMGIDGYVANHLATICVDKSNINERFLLYYLRNVDARDLIQDISYPSLKTSEISMIRIPVPPISEQQMIVAVLDEVFAAIERAKANIEKNLQNAKDLFQSELDYIFSQKGEDWEEKKLGEIATISYGFTEKASYENIGPKFLRITDITETGIHWNSVPYCRCDNKDLIKHRLETGDILFARTGATTGKSFLIMDPPLSIYASYLIRVKVNNREIILPELVSRYFQTKDYWNKITAGMTGSAQGGFNASKIGNLEISYPKARREQEIILNRLDALSTESKKLEENYRKQLANLEELKKSVLEKAFNGELTG